jgi:hypothetical protein
VSVNRPIRVAAKKAADELFALTGLSDSLAGGPARHGIRTAQGLL